MKLDNKLASQLRIPTTGMEEFNLINKQNVLITTGLYDEIKSTRFFRENGKLHHNHNQPTSYALFIQREDGLVLVCPCSSGIAHFENIKGYLSADIKADVILCSVPADSVSRHEKGYLNSEYGALEFLAQHHPSGAARVVAIAELSEREYAQANTSQSA
jgi:hypothetical protein